MNLRLWKQLFSVALAVVLAVSTAYGQEEKGGGANQAASLDELLQLIKNAQIAESKENSQREAEFERSRQNQKALLNQARAEKAAEERKSVQLEQQFADNELALLALQERLQKRLGSLKELFGHLTATAGDARAALSRSIVSAQYPGRTDFLDAMIAKMSSNTQLPTIEEIGRLWYEINREMIESGKVVTFPATVIQVDGNQVEQDVVRVGSFNLLSEGAYLEFNEKSGIISELARQPKGKFTRAAARLQSSAEGFTKVGIDPTGPSGGSFLAALISSPGWLERWRQGKTVGIIITLLGVLALLLAVWRLVALVGVSKSVNLQLKAEQARTDNPLGRVLKIGEDNAQMDVESLELKLHEGVLKERPAIEFGLGLLKIIAMVAPLLGLLGTVTGMIVTFQAITLFGAGDPQAMAGGISGALVTTVLGLCVAIPTVLLHTIINGRAQHVLHVLEEQSAGIIAEKVEG